MNLEDIKKGTHVFIPGVADSDPEGEFLYVTYKCGSNRNGLEVFRRDEAAKFLIFHPTNGIKNSEPAPKYDPCRKLKKGDTVKYSPKDGRDAYRLQPNIAYEVKSDECPCGTVEIWIYKHERYERYPYSIFELVTPVEELEPYCVKQGCEQENMVDTFPYWSVVSSDCEVARFYIEQYEEGKAKAAAEAECARLNAEHRKEQS